MISSEADYHIIRLNLISSNGMLVKEFLSIGEKAKLDKRLVDIGQIGLFKVLNLFGVINIDCDIRVRVLGTSYG